MAEIKRPGEYGHNNEDKAFTDSDAVRGGGRVVADRAALYALASKSDQLKQRVTRVWLASEAVTLVLIDATKIDEAAGWEEDASGLSFTPLLASELDTDKADFAGLALRPLLIKIINALGEGTSGETLTILDVQGDDAVSITLVTAS